MRPVDLFEFVLRQTDRPDLAMQALAHAVPSPDVLVDYAQAMRVVVAYLSPALVRLESRAKLEPQAPRLLPHAVVLGLTHAALTGHRPRAWAHLPDDELDTCLALHREVRGWTAPRSMDRAALGARVLARPPSRLAVMLAERRETTK